MPKMKDSGIKWIGAVPKDWNTEAIRYLISEHFTGSWGNDERNDWNDRICMRIADFDFDKMQFKDLGKDKFTVRNYSNSDIFKKSLKVGDLLIEKSGGGEKTPVGRTVVFRFTFPALFANFMDCIRLKDKYNVEFAKYVFYSLYNRGITNFYFNQTTGLQNLNMPRYFREVKLPVPLLQEQCNIADYLDSKCNVINTLYADIEKQIDLLEQYKKSVITEAVTKGLEPNVEMKDSGIEWIGEIPKTWNVAPIYSFFGERRNRNYDLQEQNLLSLSYGKIVRKDINTVGGLLPASFNTYNVVEAGDIIIRPTDLQNDKRSLRTGLVTEHGIITSAYIDLKPEKDVNSRYFHYLLHTYDVLKVFYNMGNGVRQGLNYSEFAKLKVFAPSVGEQQQIADYLDAKCDEIDSAIAEKKKQLETLEAYKKSLIYEYVTGKKEVSV